MARSRGLKAILLGRLVARLQPKEAQVALAAATAQAETKTALAKRMPKRQSQAAQADQIMEGLRELTPGEIKALPPKLAQAILAKYRPDALSSEAPSPKSPAVGS